MFFQLFVLIDRLIVRKIEINKSVVRKIIGVGDKILERVGLPENVKLALASRLNRLSNRNVVSDYLFENVSK